MHNIPQQECITLRTSVLAILHSIGYGREQVMLMHCACIPAAVSPHLQLEGCLSEWPHQLIPAFPAYVPTLASCIFRVHLSNLYKQWRDRAGQLQSWA